MSFQEYRPSGFNLLPPVIKNLLIINVLFFVAALIFEQKFKIDLSDTLGLHYFGSEKFRAFPYQIITYMFMHGSFMHIFFNMFALWMFGNVLENMWGGKRFLIFYVVCGLGAALTHYAIFYFQVQPVMETVNAYLSNPDVKSFEGIFQPLLSNNLHRPSAAMSDLINHYNAIPDLGNASEKLDASLDLIKQFKIDFLNEPVVIGASGAVVGLLLAFGMLFPNTMLFIMPIPFPIKAKWAVIIYGIAELAWGSANFSGDNVAHFAHLGGMLFGFILIKFWSAKGGPPAI